MMSDMERRIREQEVPWNELRERRVLERVLTKNAEATLKSARRRFLRQRFPAMIAAGFAALLIGLIIYDRNEPPDMPKGISPRPPGAKESGENEQPLVELADVGSARLSAGAVVRVSENQPRETVVTQSKGKVYYSIIKQQGRTVVILAAGVRVRVVGTKFTIDMEGSKVSVAVEEGVVSVHDGKREFALRADERIAVATNVPSEEIHRAEENAAPDALALQTLVLKDPISPANKPGEYVAKRSLEVTAKDKESIPIENTPNSAEVSAADPIPSALKPSLQNIDSLRRKGELQQAAAELRGIVARYPEYVGLPTVWFTLGNVERARDRHGDAADAYRRCFDLAVSGPLAEDALAEAASSFQLAGKRLKGKSYARKYLDRFPDGTHASRMRLLVDVKEVDDTDH